MRWVVTELCGCIFFNDPTNFNSVFDQSANQSFQAPELIQGPGVLPKRRGKQVVKREGGGKYM